MSYAKNCFFLVLMSRSQNAGMQASKNEVYIDKLSQYYLSDFLYKMSNMIRKKYICLFKTAVVYSNIK